VAEAATAPPVVALTSQQDVCELAEVADADIRFDLTVVWHLLVSHPALKVTQTKWESVK